MTDNQQVATTLEPKPMEVFRGNLKAMSQEFAMALPSQIPVERFIRTTMTAVQLNPDLLAADRRSLLAATMRAAQDGLLCDGKESALVIFNTKEKDAWIKKVQYMPMVSGMLKKLRNSGEIAGSPSVHVVKEGDKFNYELGDNEKIIHKPALENRGKTIGAYSIVKFKDGEISREFMDIAQIEGVRARSKSKDNGPWVTDFDEMARKTVFRRHQKRLPSTPELDQTITYDNENYEVASPEMLDVTPTPEPATATEAVKEKLKKRQGKMEQVPQVAGAPDGAFDATAKPDPRLTTPAEDESFPGWVVTPKEQGTADA